MTTNLKTKNVILGLEEGHDYNLPVSETFHTKKGIALLEPRRKELTKICRKSWLTIKKNNNIVPIS